MNLMVKNSIIYYIKLLTFSDLCEGILVGTWSMLGRSRNIFQMSTSLEKKAEKVSFFVFAFYF